MKDLIQDKVEDIVNRLALHPHPEGGFYRETHRSEFSTGIFYLLNKGQKSSLHRIKSDEMWHFYGGDGLMIVEITKEGALKETLLNNENVQYVVRAHTWFGAYLPENSTYALTGCTVAPAFQFADFEMGDKNLLIANYPHLKEMIEKLLA